MSKVNDIIEGGQPMPADVIGVFDCEGDELVLNEIGHWHSPLFADPTSCNKRPGVDCSVDPTDYTPLTVTAVREPEPAADESEPRCPECGCAEDQRTLCRDSWHGLMLAQRNHAAFIADGCCGMVAVHMADCPKFDAAELRAEVYKYAPESQQAETPALLDLVRQYGSAIVRFDRERRVDGDIVTTSAAATALFERIAALVPPNAPDFLASVNKLTIERDDAFAENERLKLAVRFGATARTELESRVEHLRNWRSEHDERERERDEARLEVERLRRLLKNQAENFAAANKSNAAADPSVLSLPQDGPRVFEVPQPPKGVTRVSDSQDEVWTRNPADCWWHCDGSGWSALPWHLLLGDHGPLTDTTPPREPRTWPMSVAPDDIADALIVEGHGRFVVAVRRAMPPGGTTYVHEDDVDEHAVQRGLTWTLGRLRELGDVTEVFEGEPGGAR